MCGCLGMPEDDPNNLDQDVMKEGGQDDHDKINYPIVSCNGESAGSQYPFETVEDSESVECCCVRCVCSDKVIEKEKCCCCFPIKCGIYTAAVFTILLWLFLNILALMELYNDYFDWWYVLILMIFYIPLIITVYYNLVWIQASKEDKIKAVNNLPCGCWLAIISITLAELWLIIYIVFFYKFHDVYTGFQPVQENPNYVVQTKKAYIFYSLFFTFVLCFFFAYLGCITFNVGKRYREHKEQVEKMENQNDDEQQPMIEGEEGEMDMDQKEMGMEG